MNEAAVAGACHARGHRNLRTKLVGISTPAHLDDLLAVARIPPLARTEYLALFERAE